MERGPGRVFFILTDAVGKAAWVTERALVQLIGPSATEVEDHQPNRTADRRIGPESWTKHVCPAIYGDLATHGAIYNNQGGRPFGAAGNAPHIIFRSEEHTSELQSLMRISYADFCLKKKNNKYTLTKLLLNK